MRRGALHPESLGFIWSDRQLFFIGWRITAYPEILAGK
jgi:hypothetical protein